MKKVNVAILGLGVVGYGTYEIIEKNRDMVYKTQELDINVVKVLEKNPETALNKGVPKEKICQNIDEVLADKSIDIVVETIGGIEPAKSFILKAFESGKHVVSANKELLAKHWPELEATAIKNNKGLYFEASCVGGVPIIRTLYDSMQANDILGIMGIFNGTTNYILTKMTEDKMSYEDALKEAQALGFAEANPTSDVEAYDTVYKLSILASIAFRERVDYEKIYREGITRLTSSDIESGKELGYCLRLLAIAKRIDNKIEARCHPAFVPLDHPLANVRGSFNAVFLNGDSVGDIMLYGRGAGAHPTASAIVSDILYCSRQSAPQYTTFVNERGAETTLVEDFISKYYFMIQILDVPGMIGKITTILGAHNVSMDAIIQRSQNKGYAEVIFLTHLTSEKAVQSALKEIRELDGIKTVRSIIRVI